MSFVLGRLSSMNDYVALTVGVVCAGIGGELFVWGSVGLARWMRVPPGIVGATVSAFATSIPELSVAVNAALAGKPDIALGDALGSNVTNIALILAFAAVISGIRSPRDSVKRDFPVALSVPVATGALAFDGVLSRFDGLLMMGLFFAWLWATIVEARSLRNSTDKVFGAHRGWPAILSSVVGLGCLIAAGHLVVTGARGIGVTFGIDPFVIGATIVAIGTTVPELATTTIATLRGHDEIGLGTILGSNIFNGLFIVAVAAILCPIAVRWREMVVVLVSGFVAVVLAYPAHGGFIARRRGVLLLVVYTVYLAMILQR